MISALTSNQINGTKLFTTTILNPRIQSEPSHWLFINFKLFRVSMLRYEQDQFSAGEIQGGK